MCFVLSGLGPLLGGVSLFFLFFFLGGGGCRVHRRLVAFREKHRETSRKPTCFSGPRS